MKILFLDTETSGLPNDWNAPITDLDNWPRLVQIGWVIKNELGKTLLEQERIIRPDGFEISKESVKIHGIYQHWAESTGMDLSLVLKEFHYDV